MILVTLEKTEHGIRALMGADPATGMSGVGETPADALRDLAKAMEERGGNDWAKYPKQETVLLDAIECEPTSGLPLRALIRQPLKATIWDFMNLLGTAQTPVGWVPVVDANEKLQGLFIGVVGAEEAETVQAAIRPVAQQLAGGDAKPMSSIEIVPGA